MGFKFGTFTTKHCQFAITYLFIDTKLCNIGDVSIQYLKINFNDALGPPQITSVKRAFNPR